MSQKPRGRAAVVQALEASARELFAERGPAGVSLREIADHAGVNFGLVYQYLGTKSDVLQTVYARTSEDAAARLAECESLQDAVDTLLRRGDGSAARLVAWSALDGGDTSVAPSSSASSAAQWSSPALRVLADLAERDARASGAELSHEQAQVFAALAMAVATGWRLLGPVALAAADLDPADEQRHSETVRLMLRRLAADLTHGDTSAD